MSLPLIVPDWPAPPNIRAFATTRQGGVSAAPFDSLNLGGLVGDDPIRVAANRARLRELLPDEPVWLKQVHGVAAHEAALQLGDAPTMPEADAVLARHDNVVCAIMTADCLPVLLTDRGGSVVAAAHAGWRGLCGGILEATVAAMRAAPGDLLAWLGPAIGPAHFEVGPEVREAFVAVDAKAARAFAPGKADRWMADIFLLARQRLDAAGVTGDQIYGGGVCTVSEPERFFSYRRDGATGRMASLIWRDA